MSFDIENLLTTSKEFEKKLSALSELSLTSKGNKLGVKDNQTYISWWFLQGLHRTFYGESIDKLLDYLKIVFDEYFIFNVSLRRAIQNINNEQLILLRRENDELIKKWKNGLIYLKNEYKNSPSIQKNIDELIIFLL